VGVNGDTRVRLLRLESGRARRYKLPVGTAIFMHAYSMSLDPELWDEPEKFDPER
jgi:cytochrome P450